MKAKFSKETKKKIIVFYKTNRTLYDRIQKQIKLFQISPTHPSLRLHKLSGKSSNVWSVSITKSIRALYTIENQDAYFFDIGTHDEVYN